MTFDAFTVFPRHYFKCFPLPNQQHCSALIVLAIRCNWPSITFHSKLISLSVPNQRKHNAICQSGDTTTPALLKRTPGEARAGVVRVIPECWDLPGNHLLLASSFHSHRAWGVVMPEDCILLTSDAWSQAARVCSQWKYFGQTMIGQHFFLKKLKYIYFWRLTLVCTYCPGLVISKCWDIQECLPKAVKQPISFTQPPKCSLWPCHLQVGNTLWLS